MNGPDIRTSEDVSGVDTAVGELGSEEDKNVPNGEFGFEASELRT